MRTTITFEPDVAAAIERVRRERSLGMSEVVNELVRASLVAKGPRKRFVQKTDDMGPAKVDVTNVAEAIATLDGPFWR